MADILFELGVEEVPVEEIGKIIIQLQDKFELKLKRMKNPDKAILYLKDLIQSIPT